MKSFLELAEGRYSCKKFSDRAISDEDLNYVLEAGRLAPTAKNLQPQHIYVMRSAEALEQIDKLTPCRYGAPVVAVIAYDRDNVFTFPGGRATSGAEDVSIVATHMMLAAADRGLNSCWLNFFDPDKAAAELDLPDNETVVLLLDLGLHINEIADWHGIFIGADQELDCSGGTLIANLNGREVRHFLYHSIECCISIAAKTDKCKLLLISNILLIAHGTHTGHNLLGFLKVGQELLLRRAQRLYCNDIAILGRHDTLAILALIYMLPQLFSYERHEGVYQLEQAVEEAER